MTNAEKAKAYMDGLKEKMIALPEKVLPYTFYRAIVIGFQRIKSKGARSYYEDYFLKWRPFSKKKYCIIRVEFPVHAIFTAAKRYLFAAEYARSKGMYPIMDLERLADFRKGILYGENIWKDVFQQKNVRELLKEDATIYVCRICASWNIPETCMDINHNPTDNNIHVTEENWREYYRNIHKYVKKYWKFNQNIIREVQQKSKGILDQSKKILGISLREEFSEEFYTQMKNLKQRKAYRDHPLVPDINETLDIVSGYLERWNCDKIFVASVYSDSIQRFEEKFPGRVVYLERDRLSVTGSIRGINARNKFIDESLKGDRKCRYLERKRQKEYVQEKI